MTGAIMIGPRPNIAALLCITCLAWLGLSAAASAQGGQPEPRGNTKPRPAAGAPSAAADKYAFELPNIDGKGKLAFADLVDCGKPFLIFFWRTDCPLCHMQMPYVQQLQRLIEDGKVDLRIVSICVDDTTGDALAFIEDKGLTFEVLHDGHGRRMEAKYHLQDIGLPLTYAFKKGGEFVDYLTGFRSGYAKNALQLLDLPLPDELKKK
jgi:thiol-disulfide isomerase/thioredoxin